jgi:hypothetical protein
VLILGEYDISPVVLVAVLVVGYEERIDEKIIKTRKKTCDIVCCK